MEFRTGWCEWRLESLGPAVNALCIPVISIGPQRVLHQQDFYPFHILPFSHWIANASVYAELPLG